MKDFPPTESPDQNTAQTDLNPKIELQHQPNSTQIL